MDPVVIISLIFVCLCLYMIYYTSHQRSKGKKEISKLKKEKNSNLFIALLHFYGLPISKNVVTQIFSTPSEYEFIAGNNSFKLSKDKVTDVTITTDVEVQKNNVSSIGGAIGGAALFGPIGAMIGGRSKEKTSKIVHSYLIFTFLDNNDLKYVAFDCTNNFQAHKFVKEFKAIENKKTTTINL